MKKILVDKNEGIAEVIDRILAESDDEITVVLPKDSALIRSPRNFHLLKREADAADKNVDIESVDETILALANDAGLGSGHPLLRRSGGSLSDIVSVSSERSSDETVVLHEKKEPSKKKGTKAKQHAAEDEPVSVKIQVHEKETASVEEMHVPSEQSDDADKAAAEEFFSRPRFFAPRDIPDDEPEPGRRFPWKGIWIGVAVAAIIAAGLFVVTDFFGRAQISIDFQKTPWHYAANFTGNVAVSTATASSQIIPAQVFTENKNISQQFPATGVDTVSEKANGTLTIYNAYSSAPQTLVATTRFVTPDGTIFRLASQVIVPGAKITNGQIVPSSINAAIVADQPGPDYNVGPVAKLTVPGFQGTPKYAGFYGSIASGTSGGFVGKKAVPTEQDITDAEASATAMLQQALQNTAGLTIPARFKILPGATSIQIGKLSLSTTTDQNGNFSVFGEATYRAIGFDEDALKSLLLGIAQSTEASSTFNSLTLTYGSSTPDFTNGVITFPLTADGQLEPAFSADDFRTSIVGENIGNVRAAIAALPNLSDGKISVWPVWLWSIPSDVQKIDITVN